MREGERRLRREGERGEKGGKMIEEGRGEG